MEKDLVRITNTWKLILFIITLIPILFLGAIYLSYGFYLDPYLEDIELNIHFFKISNQLSFFESSLKTIPISVKLIGMISVKMLNLIFFVWLFFNLLFGYIKLSKRVALRLELFFELFIGVLVYVYFISPENIILYIIGAIVLFLNLFLIISYWIYEIKSNR